jgi:hypothetical protein
MGFFSGLTGTAKVKTPATGLYAQTPQFQAAYNTVGNNVNNTLPQINAQMFTPTPLSAGEQNAIGNLSQGFTPTAESLQSDINMLNNPFNDSVINEINRQAAGQNSLVNQNAAAAGQQGSNRSFLGSSDVEQNRLNNIGLFKQSQYDNAINNSLNTLTNSRRQDALGALTGGSYSRDLDAQTAQAPLAALQAQQGLLGPLSMTQGNQAYSSGGGFDLGKTVQSAGQIAALAAFFSDENLKENIKPMGQENGHNIYEFTYKSDPS